jgi:hypothetical protein
LNKIVIVLMATANFAATPKRTVPFEVRRVRGHRKAADNFILLSPTLFCVASVQARLPMVLQSAR